MKTDVPLDAILLRLGREERRLKNAGAYAEAAGVRDAVVLILRLADEGEPPIDPSEVSE